VKLKIKHKLFFTLLLSSAIVSLALHLFVTSSFERGFKEYVKIQELEQLELLTGHLQEYYQQTGGWNFIVGNHRLWQKLHRETSLPIPPGEEGFAPIAKRPPGPPMSPPSGQEPDLRPGQPGIVGQRLILFDSDKKWIIGGAGEPQNELQMIPIKQQDTIIGYIGLVPAEKLEFDRDRHFLKQQVETFAFIPVIIVVLSLLLSFPVTIHLLRPINALTKGTRKLIAGRFVTRIPVNTGDELGRLSKDFNTLAMTLENNEKNRKQWVADISHELRTPLSVLRGEVEALQDGIRRPDPQTLGILHGEVMQLERMVSDLYELSMSDVGALNYKRVEVNPIGILEGTVESFEHRLSEKELKLTLHHGGVHSCTLLADPERLQQLFTNLLENSLRYTDGPGMIHVNLMLGKEYLTVTIEDSTPTVPKEHLGQLFDRFYRVEGSRNRKTGGAGLGLAICKNIVEAHEGKITAESSLLGGIMIKIELPLALS
jgi:two-component system sensor histidine kinase BaeS